MFTLRASETPAVDSECGQTRLEGEEESERERANITALTVPVDKLWFHSLSFSVVLTKLEAQTSRIESLQTLIPLKHGDDVNCHRTLRFQFVRLKISVK